MDVEAGHRSKARAKANWKRIRDEFEAATKLNREAPDLTMGDIFIKYKRSSPVVISITEYLHGPSNPLNNVFLFNKPKPYIQSVPDYVRGKNEKAYLPKLVSIGPLHHGRSHLQIMQQHKLRFLARLLNRSPSSSSWSSPYWDNEEIVGLVRAMKKLEKKTRESYAKSFSGMKSDDFVHMMILDGCFIIELLLLFAESDKEYVGDPIFTTRWMVPILQRDLVLLENQLPFHVVEQLFRITVVEKGLFTSPSLSLAELILHFFNPLLPREQKILDKCNTYLIQDKYKVHLHLLGLFRSTFISSLPPQKRSSPIENRSSQIKQKEINVGLVQDDVVLLIHCVRELKEAGIKFEERKGFDLLDIDFNKGRLKIPHLLVDDNTASVLLNFVAQELCVEGETHHFTNYVLFFDSLVNSSMDVEILHYTGIMSHLLGSDEEVADLLNNLCKQVAAQVVYDGNNGYLAEILNNVNKYFEVPRHKWVAKWKHDYFSNPWAFISLIAAVFLLALTVAQTVFSVLAYVRPP